MNHHRSGTISTIASRGNPRIYPRRYFELSPTWFTWNKISTADIHALHDERGFEGQQIAFHSNHPIRFVRVVGLVVGIELTKFGKYTLICLDDGGGACIEVKIGMRPLEPDGPTYPSNTLVDCIDVNVEWAVPSVLVNREAIDIGSVLKVKARLDSFMGKRQLMPERIWIVKDTNAEAQAWAEVAAWKRDVLSKPWKLTAQEIATFDEKLRKEEALEREQMRKKMQHRAKYDEKRRKRDEKRERHRMQEERVLNDGALPGSHVIREPWD